MDNFEKWCQDNGIKFRNKNELRGGRKVFDAASKNQEKDGSEAKRLIKEMLNRLSEIELGL